jgi:hypothetical protein
MENILPITDFVESKIIREGGKELNGENSFQQTAPNNETQKVAKDLKVRR